MKIIQKRLNNTYIRNGLSRSKEKDKTINIINNNNNIENKLNILGNINTNRSYNKTKLIKKNKKVKFSIPINIKNNKSNYTIINNNNRFNNKNNNKNNDTIISTNINSHNITTNLKKNIIHRHTKSSFIQKSNLLLNNKVTKDISMTNLNNNLINNEFHDINASHKKKFSLNNFSNNETRYSMNSMNNFINKKMTNKALNKSCNNNNKIKKSKNIQMQTKSKKNLTNKQIYHPPLNIKDGLVKIIEEINTDKNSHDNNNGFSKKFIEAQNNWRKNYFAIVIQKIYRGYFFRKNYKNIPILIHASTSRKNKKNENVNNVIYIKKKIKDNNHYYNSATHHKEYPTEENNYKVPHKIKEIVISMKINKPSLNEDNIYNNNYMFLNMNNNVYYSKTKNAFKKWKEYSNKISIIKKLKIYKKYKKNTFRKSSYEKRRSNNRYKI